MYKDCLSIIKEKVTTLELLSEIVKQRKSLGQVVCFTNGCFDILHIGHLHSLCEAATEGDFLVVGINSDASVKRLKGPSRPLNNENSRALMLAGLEVVGAVVVFDEQTPLNLIKTLLPDVLVKGGDYTVETIVGAKEVIENGGRVVINPIVEGFSTTGILEEIVKLG